MCLRMSEEKTFQRTLPGHKIYTNQGEGFQVDKTVPEPTSRVWLARDDISEWKQWVLLRLAPYHWQRAGGSRLCKPKSLLLLECSALGASSRTVGPPGPPSEEAFGVRDSAVEGAPTTVNPKRNSKRPR